MALNIHSSAHVAYLVGFLSQFDVEQYTIVDRTGAVLFGDITRGPRVVIPWIPEVDEVDELSMEVSFAFGVYNRAAKRAQLLSLFSEGKYCLPMTVQDYVWFPIYAPHGSEEPPYDACTLCCDFAQSTVGNTTVGVYTVDSTSLERALVPFDEGSLVAAELYVHGSLGRFANSPASHLIRQLPAKSYGKDTTFADVITNYDQLFVHHASCSYINAVLDWCTEYVRSQSEGFGDPLVRNEFADRSFKRYIANVLQTHLAVSEREFSPDMPSAMLALPSATLEELGGFGPVNGDILRGDDEGTITGILNVLFVSPPHLILEEEEPVASDSDEPTAVPAPPEIDVGDSADEALDQEEVIRKMVVEQYHELEGRFKASYEAEWLGKHNRPPLSRDIKAYNRAVRAFRAAHDTIPYKSSSKYNLPKP
jgi:hypothetical protein